MKDGEGAAQMEGSSGTEKLTLSTAVKRAPSVSREKTVPPRR